MSWQTEIITGRHAVVNEFPTFGNLEMDYRTRVNPTHHSGGQGGVDRPPGCTDFEGRILAYGHTPPTFPGETFSLAFTIGGSDQASCSSVRCMGLHIIVPVKDPAENYACYYIAEFGAAGVDMTYGTGSLTDTATPAIYPVAGLTCTLDGSEENNVTMMDLYLRNITQAEPTSSSNGVFYRAKGDLDWIFRYHRDVNSMSLLPAQKSVKEIAVQVASGTSWLCNYGRCIGHQPEIDRNTNRMIGATVTFGKCIKSDGTVGYVKDPTGATKWPS